MNFRNLVAFATFALAVGLVLITLSGSKTKAALATCSVPSASYPTIQSAVNDVSCSTINVAPGIYVENVTIPRSLTLNGAQAGNDVDGRTFASPGESTVNGKIEIQAVNVTIDGFSLTNPGQGTGILIKTAGDNALITNNIIDTIGATTLSSNAQAIYLEHGPDNVRVAGNRINNVTSIPTSNGGILIGDSTAANPSLNILIEDNSITNITSVLRGAYAIQVNNGSSTAPSAIGYTTVEIRNNTINNLVGGGWAHAIGLEGDTPNVRVEGNDITNLTDLTPTVPSNSIAVFFEANPSFATAQVHSNNFNLTAASYGIAVHPALTGGSVNGECNWWNSPTGPTSVSNPGGTGAQVSPNVDYAPWLIAPGPNGACIGGNVPTNPNQCKKDGWKTSVRADGTVFKNQGDCVSYTNNGK